MTLNHYLVKPESDDRDKKKRQEEKIMNKIASR